MSNRHTSGPWSVEPRGNLKARQFIEAGEFRIAECITRDHEANARLIAAAPDLLAALQDLANWLVCWSIASAEDMAQSFETMSRKAEAAIARAEGKP